MNKKVILSGLVPLVLAGGFLGFGIFRSKGEPESVYKTETVVRGDVRETVTTTGTLNPVSIVDIGSQVSGRIEAVHVDFNSPVKAGQILAELDPASFLSRIDQDTASRSSAQAAVDKARVSLSSAEKNRSRYRELSEKDLIPFEELENAEAQYLTALSDLKSAEARLEQAESQLESSRVDLNFTVLRSPIDGVVINRSVNVGQTVAASLQSPVLFQIAENLTDMKVECSVDEADIGLVETGQTAVFSVDAFPGRTFAGTVSQVRYAPEIVQNVVTYTALVDVANPELELLPGMTATVSIVTAEAKQALIIPAGALRFSPQSGTGSSSRKQTIAGAAADPRLSSISRAEPDRDTTRIWILDDSGSIQPIQVTAGISDGSRTAVTGDGLSEGLTVVTGRASRSSSRDPARSGSLGDVTRMLSR